MFGLLTRSPRKRKAVAPRTVTLGLERLEDRLAPSGGPPGTMSISPKPIPQETLNLQFAYQPNKYVQFSGGVSNTPNPGGQTIQFSGAVSGTATTAANGSFSATLKANDLGAVNVTSISQPCNTVTVTLVSGQPVISNFQAFNEGNGMWLFTGTVSGAPTQGEVVDFGGIAALEGKSVAVNADGSFSFCVVVQGGQGGMVWAEAVDWWGNTSNAAQAPVGC